MKPSDTVSGGLFPVILETDRRRAAGDQLDAVGNAGRAGPHRRLFAQRFKGLVGSTAMEYLSHWRMLKAADRLRAGKENVASIAYSLGDGSESAFSTAFKRVMAQSPSQYRRQMPAGASEPA
ncbi:TPA: helix-turn-helix transcriptional regulator [Serratia marcescens]|nr:hypothetical protein C2M07_07415 [Serratia marcescens]PNU50601.1 hypothetical protein C2M03_00125 [Serratia marcescens]HAT5010764.1 helix-turn-helix transcriptional regulator [Serratia marcescens]